MKSRIQKYFIISIVALLLFSYTNINVKSNESYTTTDIDNLAFKQELTIPIDTSLDESKFQPIDIRIDFNSPCWAKDEKHHSVRVAFDDGSDLSEIESQIYDLEFSGDTNIVSCSLVFLIPEEADGNEQYFVLYDSSEVDASEYEDHLGLEDTHYFYEPISGQKIDFDYYKITQGEFVIYGIIQKGEIIGNPMSQNIAKVTPNAKEFETNTIDQLASFDFRYGVFGEPDYTGPAAATKVNKNILVDGNLMVRLRIESFSPSGDVKTDNIYTYYFCPTDTKRIFVDVNHEVLETVDIQDPDILDGIYAGIITIKSRSTTIEKMNVGDLLPSFHVYDEDETIKEFFVPPDPETVTKEIILSTEDDVDLGSKGWICLDDPSTGKVHGLIMHSNIGLVEEEDGVQIKAYVKQNIKLPGLEGDTGSVYLGRNTYEKGGSQTTVLPEGFRINFDISFISDEKGGYELIDSESEIIQTLLKTIPVQRGNVTKGEEDVEKFTLTTYVHLAPSAPMGSLLSAATGKNIPYIYAELYKESSFKSSGSVGRLPLGAIDLDLEGKKFLQKIRTVLGLFDWKNASFFKKIKFPDLVPGTYVVKIFRENRFFGKERQYIGFAVVDLEKDEKINIKCRPEGSIKLSIFDQNDLGVENVKFSLNYDDASISEMVTDINGTVVLKAPYYPLKSYTLKVIYQGFLVEEKKVSFKLINRFIQKKESFSIEHYSLALKLKDIWGFSPAVEVNPTLGSSEMVEPVSISAEKTGEGEYLFTNLYPASYSLNLKYKSFEVVESVSVENDESLDLSFPAEYEINLDLMNSYGYSISEGEVSISRNGKKETTSINENGKAKISAPPGVYEIIVITDDAEIAKQEISIRGDKELDILTSEDSALHTTIFYLGVILAVFSVLFIFWKKNIHAGFKLLVIALLIIALVSPWWVLNGDDGTVTTSTNTFLIPSKIISFSSSTDVIGGDISQVPEEVTMVLGLLSILVGLSCLIIFISIFIKNKLRKTTIILSILSIILIVMILGVFYYVMSQITDVGVGSFIGSADLETSLPGTAESKIIPSTWGPGLGFYMTIISFILIFLLFFQKRFLKIAEKFKRK